jgi:ectoine hydroxylase-related dioxygenase (phytanoyl-CoA dioxygenase family)
MKEPTWEEKSMSQDVRTRLTADEIEFFKENGYLSLQAVMPQEEVERMREIYDRLFEQRAGREEGNQFDLAGSDEEGKEASLPQILWPSRYAPEINQMSFRENLLGLSRQLLGEKAEQQGEHAILKPAGRGAPTPWHQDEAYWEPTLEYNALSIWMPLQEATVENGCMWFIPGSNKWDVQPHHSINNDPRIHGLEIDSLDDSDAQACPIPAGGATFHNSRTLHYAGANKTSAPRRAYICAYGTPTRKRAEPRSYPWLEQQKTARLERQRSYEGAQTGSNNS